MQIVTLIYVCDYRGNVHFPTTNTLQFIIISLVNCKIESPALFHSSNCFHWLMVLIGEQMMNCTGRLAPPTCWWSLINHVPAHRQKLKTGSTWMLDGPSRPCVPPVWVCFCDLVAPEGPFTTFTALLAPFQSWGFSYFLPPLALRRYLCRKIGATMIQRDGGRRGMQINRFFFFLTPIASPEALPPAKNTCRKSHSSSWTLGWKFFCAFVCIFFGSAKDIFTQLCCGLCGIVCLADTRLLLLQLSTFTYTE